MRDLPETAAAATSLWHSPWWWLSLVSLCAGTLLILLLGRRARREELQESRLQRYLANPHQQQIEDEIPLFQTEAAASWQARERQKMQRLLQQAGFHQTNAVQGLIITKLLAALATAAIAFPLLDFSDTGNSLSWWLLLGLAFVGNLVPDYYLAYRKGSQRQEILRALPDNLDLMVICLESGATLDRALALVTEQLQDIYPALTREWQVTLDHLKVNPDRQAVLSDLAARNNLDEITALVTVLHQSERFGAPLAQSLKNFANEIRELRKIALEEKIAKLASKITLPMLVLIFLPLLVMILAPHIAMLTDALKGMQ